MKQSLESSSEVPVSTSYLEYIQNRNIKLPIRKSTENGIFITDIVVASKSEIIDNIFVKLNKNDDVMICSLNKFGDKLQVADIIKQIDRQLIKTIDDFYSIVPKKDGCFIIKVLRKFDERSIQIYVPKGAAQLINVDKNLEVMALHDTECFNKVKIGDIVSKVNQIPINSVEEFHNALAEPQKLMEISFRYKIEPEIIPTDRIIHFNMSANHLYKIIDIGLNDYKNFDAKLKLISKKVIVTSIPKESVLNDYLTVGDVILDIDEERILSKDDAFYFLKESIQKYGNVSLLVERSSSPENILDIREQIHNSYNFIIKLWNKMTKKKLFKSEKYGILCYELDLPMVFAAEHCEVEQLLKNLGDYLLLLTVDIDGDMPVFDLKIKGEEMISSYRIKKMSMGYCYVNDYGKKFIERDLNALIILIIETFAKVQNYNRVDKKIIECAK